MTFHPFDDQVFDFSEKGIPPEPNDPRTSSLFDAMDRAGDVFGAPNLIPDAPPEYPSVPDLGPGASTEAPDDGITFQAPSGATDVQVTIDEPTSPAGPPAATTIVVPPPREPPAPEPPPVTDDISLSSVGQTPAPTSPDPGSPPPPATASMPMPAFAPAPSTLSDADTAAAIVLIRAISWPGSAESVSEANTRVFLLWLLMHLYAPASIEEEQRRVDFLTWLEIFDWIGDDPTTDELVSAASLELILANPEARLEAHVPDAMRVDDGEILHLHDTWVLDAFPNGISPGAERRSRGVPIDSGKSAATWLDYPDALVSDWDRITAANRAIHLHRAADPPQISDSALMDEETIERLAGASGPESAPPMHVDVNVPPLPSPSAIAPSGPLDAPGSIPESIAPTDPRLFHSSTTWLEGVLRSRYPGVAFQTRRHDPELEALGTAFAEWVVDTVSAQQLTQSAVETRLGDIDGYIRAHYQDLLAPNVGRPSEDRFHLAPDEFDALIGDLPGSVPPPDHSVIKDLGAETESPAASGPTEGTDGSVEPRETPVEDVRQEFRTYLTTPFGGGWAAAQLDNPAGAARAEALFDRFMTWAYGDDWKWNDTVSEQPGAWVTEYISEYFSSGAADDQTAAAEGDAVPSLGDAAPAEATPNADVASSSDGIMVTAIDPEADAIPPSLAASAPGPAPRPSRTLVGSGIGVLIVLLLAAAIFVAHPFGPASTTGSGTTAGGTTPIAGASSGPASTRTTTTASGNPTTGFSLNNGAPETGTAVLTTATGGCTGFSSGATSAAYVDAASGKMSLGIFAAGSQPLLGTVAADGAYTVASADGAAKAQGTVGPTGLGGTLTVTRTGCTETLAFTITLGASGGGVAVTPHPSFVQPTFVAIIIDHNSIFFEPSTAIFCKEPYTITFSYRIVGIEPDTPVVVVQTGPETPSGPQTYRMNEAEDYSVEYDDPGGPGVWTSTIISINGAPPPFPTGAKEGTSINC